MSNVDINKPVTNPDLVKAMKKMQENPTKDNQDIFLAEVMKAHFLTPVVIDPQPKHKKDLASIKKGTKINFGLITNQQEQSFFIAFSDWNELKKWKNNENQQTLVVTYKDLETMILGNSQGSNGFVINPFGENVLFNREMINVFKDIPEQRTTARPYTVEKETTVKLGQPREYPHQMIDVIRKYMRKHKEIKKGFLQLMVKDNEQSYSMIVDFDGDKDNVFSGIANAAMPFLNGFFIDMVPLNSDFGQSASKDVEPFYVKKRGLFL